jgi:adenylate cyclase
VALIAGLGWACMLYQFAGGVKRLSYDLPLSFRNAPTPEVCIVYMDESAARGLGQKFGIWDRAIHAELVRKLAREGARAVFFDITFVEPWDDPTRDEQLAAAFREHGNVFIAAMITRDNTRQGAMEQVFPPIDKLADAAADWGLVVFSPDDDFGVRKLDTGNESLASSSWLMAQKLGAPLSDDPEVRALPRWINYYGEVGKQFEEVSYHRVFQPDGVRPGFFKDRVVFVGGRSAVGTIGLGTDDFAQPHTRWTNRFAPGVAIHATVFLNLLRGEWLVRWSDQQEVWFAVAFGVFLAITLPLCRPAMATLLALACAGAVTALACWLVWEKQTWFAWGVPVLIQTPIALGWAIGTRYFLEERRRTRLRNAFGHYLSPNMADRIANADFDLTPGGEIVEATIIFTDLQGFTALSENLGDPRKLSEVLIAYFTNTTQHVVENEGTIIKYIGDAVLAVWGAPLADPKHAIRATRAAWHMHVASGKEVLGHKLITRVGIHTGEVLAGNLGSPYRFDYTVIGDAVNFAARLEGLNKYLGTRILISDVTVSQSAGEFITRRLGDFKVVGKEQTVGIHELIAPASEAEPMPWLEAFNLGTAAFRKGDLAEAARLMEEVREMRGGHDGPAEFYLERIKPLQAEGLPENWTGALELSSK